MAGEDQPPDYWDSFEWASEDQKKGFLALIKDLKDANLIKSQEHLAPSLGFIVAWFIQKDLESNQWWTETLSRQLAQLKIDIQVQIDEIRSELPPGRNP